VAPEALAYTPGVIPPTSSVSTSAWTVLRGFLMGAADVVPGVSGGTVALVLGIYERLVRSIRSAGAGLGRLVSLDLAAARERLGAVEWRFVVPLAAGVLLAVVTLAGLLERLLDEQPVVMAGLFTGLIAGSGFVAGRLVRRWGPWQLVTLAIATLALFVLLGVRSGTTEDTVTQLTDPAIWAFLASGAVAICAMILPGISGSFILVLLGMYGPVLAAVNDRELLVLAVFVVGTVVGLAAFSQVLHWALQHHHDTVMASLIGLMVGSIRVVWPWPDGLDSTILGRPDTQVAVTAVAAVAACAVVIVLGLVGHRLEAARHTSIPRQG